MTTIQAGYRLTVVSWENDGDNYNTKTIDGLSIERVRLLVDLCRLHASRNISRGFGNMYDANDDERLAYHTAIQDVLDKHPVSMDIDEAESILYDLALQGGEFYTRVLDKFKVEYIPHQINLLDVTDQFK